MPNLGVYLDRPPYAIPDQGLQDCLNVRIKEGRIKNEHMGWEPFNDLNLDDNPCLLIDQFILRSGSQILIFGTDKDLYYFNDATSDLRYITPWYGANQVDVVNGSPTVTESGGADFETNGIKAGDKIWIGDADYNEQGAGWYEVLSVAVGGTTLTLTANYTGSTATEDYTIRKLFTGDIFSFWVSESFPDAQENDEDTWFATNGSGKQIVKWNGSDDFVTEIQGTGELEFTCGYLARYKDMMLYGDILESGESKSQVIKNSAISHPETVDGTDESGEFASSEGVDTLLALEPLADLIVAYHERSINLLQFIGPPLNFLIRTAIPGIGPISGRCVMNFGDYHEFVGPDTGYRFDGISLTEHGGQLFREVLRGTDPNRLDQALAHIDEENGEVLWVIPLTTDEDVTDRAPEKAFSEHYLELTKESDPVPMAIRELPATAMGFYESSSALRFSDLSADPGDEFSSHDFPWNDRYFAASFPLNLFGSAAGDIFQLGTVNNQDGEAILSFARFNRFVVMDERRKGVLTRIEPAAGKRAAVDYGLTTLIYSTDFPDGDVSLLFTEDFDLTHASRRHMSVRKAARFAEVEFRTDGADEPWEIIGYATEAVPGSER